MRLLCWNVNGLRAAAGKGLLEWMGREAADVVCLQEIKAMPEQVDESILHPEGYQSYWHPALKKGYSGVLTYCREEPLNVVTGIGDPEIDAEGRVLITEHPEFTLINAYFPNSQEGGARLDFKLRFCDRMLRLCNKLRREGKHVVLCGDYNIAHRPIDLARPKENEKSAGYLPEERDWMEKFVVKHGWVDIFRELHPEPDQYTWWSFRSNARAKNVGWRIDYHCIDEGLRDRIADARIHAGVMGSDHCPVELRLKQ